MASSSSEIKATEGFADGDLGVRDSLAKDAADSHRHAGSIPPVDDINDYLSGILDGMDRKAADAKPATITDATKKPGAAEREFYRRGGTPDQFGEWTVERKPSEMRLVEPPSDDTYRKFWGLVRKRLRVIARKPEWRAKVEEAIGNPHDLFGHRGADRQTECLNRIRAVLYEYQVRYGSALKEPPKKLIFS